MGAHFNKYRLLGSLLILLLLVNTACSKGSDDPDNEENDNGSDSKITMVVDGKKVQTKVAHISTFRPDASHDTEGFSLQIYGTDYLPDETGDEATFKLFIDLAFLTEGEFKKPVGTYKVGNSTLYKIASARYIVEPNNNYSSDEDGYSEDEEAHDVGKFTVESVKLDDIKVYGASIGEGYRRLVGSFEMELTNSAGKSVKITDGKFDVKNRYE